MAKFDDMAVGAELPPLTVPVTVALVNGGAMATRDYFPGHHDLQADVLRVLDQFEALGRLVAAADGIDGAARLVAHAGQQQTDGDVGLDGHQQGVLTRDQAGVGDLGRHIGHT